MRARLGKNGSTRWMRGPVFVIGALLISPGVQAESPFEDMEGIWKTNRIATTLASGQQRKLTEPFRFVLIESSCLSVLQPNSEDHPVRESVFLANDHREGKYYLLAEKRSGDVKTRYALSIEFDVEQEERLTLVSSRFPAGSLQTLETELLRRPSPEEVHELRKWLREVLQDDAMDDVFRNQAQQLIGKLSSPEKHNLSGNESPAASQSQTSVSDNKTG